MSGRRGTGSTARGMCVSLLCRWYSTVTAPNCSVHPLDCMTVTSTTRHHWTGMLSWFHSSINGRDYSWLYNNKCHSRIWEMLWNLLWLWVYCIVSVLDKMHTRQQLLSTMSYCHKQADVVLCMEKYFNCCSQIWFVASTECLRTTNKNSITYLHCTRVINIKFVTFRYNMWRYIIGNNNNAFYAIGSHCAHHTLPKLNSPLE